MPLSGEYLPSTADWARTQAEAFEASNGADASSLRGAAIIVLTTVGAKTGGLCKTALMRVEHDGHYAIVASKGGAPQPPAWYWNVRANPHVELQDADVKLDYTAREVDGDEYAQWWERAVAAWPDYAEYQKKTDRRIALFVLDPIEH
jgi:F420H(2)-dependent quinone reductase